MLVLSTCPTITFAQEESPPNALQAILHTVRIGQRLRITTRDQLTIQGAYAGIREGHVVLVENGDHAVPLDEIDIIWRRTQRTREGAILGGMTGAAYGLWLCSVFGQEYSISARGYALNSGLFASIGALPGALLGAFVPKWQEI
ncbi:MAG: hypothetical protein MUF51_08200, partial [Vicinamibacteria bacterium]|nr:hypothetical protein [Vicinamibacteria bacterium]